MRPKVKVSTIIHLKDLCVLKRTLAVQLPDAEQITYLYWCINSWYQCEAPWLPIHTYNTTENLTPGYTHMWWQSPTTDLVLVGHNLGQLVHGDTLLQVLGGNIQMDAIYSGPRSKGRERNNDTRKYFKTWYPLWYCCHRLYRLYQWHLAFWFCAFSMFLNSFPSMHTKLPLALWTRSCSFQYGSSELSIQSTSYPSWRWSSRIWFGSVNCWSATGGVF